MATDVVMPQMGESVAEGTIVRWLKKVGDTVERDEPLFEISTDKVDAEIPSPVAGVIIEIRHKEGETVEINTVVAVIDKAGSQPVTSAQPAAAPAAPAPPVAAPVAAAAPAAVAPPEPHYHAVEPQAPIPPRSTPAAPPAPPAAAPTPAPAGEVVVDESARQRTSPLVRKIAKEHDVDVSQIAGTGIDGRVTKNDILSYIGEAAPGTPAQARPMPPSSVPPEAPVGTPTPAARPASAPPKGPSASAGVGLAGQTVPMSVMRKKIAEHMIASRRTSAHVHSVFEVSFARVEKIRQAKKAEYERQGAKLTYLSFILKAAADALKAVPVINASVSGDNVVYHEQVNIGVAVALDWGLIVPVIKDADKKSLLDLSRTVVDMAGRAREKKLKPEEVSGGTFTITNPGVFGALFGMPIINQPQVAILGVGAIEKRAVVIDDAIAIRHMAYLGIGYDHRIVDGAIADEFMSHVKKAIENWDPANA